MPVFGTSAATFNDDGVTALFQELRELLGGAGLGLSDGALAPVSVRHSSVLDRSCRPRGSATSPRSPRPSAATTRTPSGSPRRPVGAAGPRSVRTSRTPVPTGPPSTLSSTVRARTSRCWRHASWPAGPLSSRPTSVSAGRTVRDREMHTSLVRETLSGNRIRRVPLPRYSDDGDLVRSCAGRTCPALPVHRRGVPLQARQRGPGTDVRRRGDPFSHGPPIPPASEGQPATRLSTAFDSVTLYGRYPGRRPDIHCKAGTSGVSVATLEDMEELYAGFDLTSPTTSVSMTINGRPRRSSRSCSTP